MPDRPFALVTGSTRNIGRAIALELAARGFDIGLNGRSGATDVGEIVGEIESRGGRAMYLPGDMSDPAAVAALFQRLERQASRLDVLVNNAALRRERALADMSFEEWREIVHGQLDGLFLCTKAALPYLARSQHPRIVNIGGVSAHVGAAERTHVVTAKAGVVGFTRALARELAPQGILVNTVVPGTIDTSRAGPGPTHVTAANTPLGRRGSPEEVAYVVGCLCEPGAAYVTGQAIHVNGGAYLSG